MMRKSFFPMTAKADVKALTEHMMFLMLQIASRRKRQREGNVCVCFFFLSTSGGRLSFIPSRSRFEQKTDVLFSSAILPVPVSVSTL